MEVDLTAVVDLFTNLTPDKKRVAMAIIALMDRCQTVQELEEAAMPLIASQGYFVEMPLQPPVPLE